MQKKSQPFTPSAKSQFLNLPNALTIVRILVIPVVIALLYPKHGPRSDMWAAVLFGLAFCTDFIDGHIARRTQTITRLGQILDPLADKLIVLSAVLLLIHLGRMDAIIGILLLGRELAVSGLRSFASSEEILLPSSRSAKIKTVAEGFALGFLMAGPENHQWGIPWMKMGEVLIFVALALALWSGAFYFVQYYRAVKARSS